MKSSPLRSQVEILQGEGLKTAAEVSLNLLGRSALGRKALETYAFGLSGRIENPALHTSFDGVELDNPVILGAGWDKKGRALIGIYSLGFGGAELGTVLPFGQPGNDEPRMWTITPGHDTGLNRLGFNSPGDEKVEDNLVSIWPLPFPVGLNAGKNKNIPNEMAPWAHARVIKHLGNYAAWITLGISSPNTKDLRKLQEKEALRENILAAQAANSELDTPKPLYVKISPELSDGQLHDVIEVMLELGGAGIVATNTYAGQDLKRKYGPRWANEDGGLSGADPDYRRLTTSVVRRIYEEAGDKLTVHGVGGIGDTTTALDKIMAGATAVQLVTAMRPSWGRVAADINTGLLEYMDKAGVKNVSELIGANTKRGAKAA